MNSRIERSAVSGKTKYLVAGFEMEDGRPITEGSKYRAAVAKGVKIINEDDLLQMIRDSNPEGASKCETAQLVKEKNELLAEQEVMKGHISTPSTLLTVKYAPHSLQEIIGNPKVIENLQLWLKEWNDVHIHRKCVTLIPYRNDCNSVEQTKSRSSSSIIEWTSWNRENNQCSSCSERSRM